MLLATNQADSIMGSLGLARSDEYRAVQAVLRLEDFNGKDTLDENYAALWAALEAELSALSAQGADSGAATRTGPLPFGRDGAFLLPLHRAEPQTSLGMVIAMCRCVVALW